MKTLREFKEEHGIAEDLNHAINRYHLQNKVYNMRASASARANPNTTRTSPEEHERLSNKALRSFELRKKKTDTLQKAQAADRKANPPKSDPDFEYNVRYPKGHVAGD